MRKPLSVMNEILICVPATLINISDNQIIKAKVCTVSKKSIISIKDFLGKEEEIFMLPFLLVPLPSEPLSGGGSSGNRPG